MKKLLLLFVSAVMLLASVTVYGADIESGELLTVKALGIITGDTSGNINLNETVTRAQFAKMLVCASEYKDTAVKSYTSVYKDVKNGHWAGGYIKTTVEQGWMSGYIDGSFKPDKAITYEEAASAVLSLLGYESADITGAYPYAQISKFESIGLADGISKSKGDTVTKNDCVHIFYNLLNTETKEGRTYASVIGYDISSKGSIDYTAVIKGGIKGPYIADSSSDITGILGTDITVYRNGNKADLSDLQSGDVYYYNKEVSTVWLYNNTVSGTYTAASPSTVSPETVTVAGKSYTIGSSTAAYKLSDLGEYSIGDIVTLSLGMNNEVVDVATVKTAAVANGSYYGIVTETGYTAYTDGNGKITASLKADVVCTDGSVRSFNTDNDDLEAGDLVSVTYSGGNTVVKEISAKSITGTVSSDGAKLGNVAFASNVEILDTTEDGGYARIYTTRLANKTISGGDVRYYTLASDGSITSLILNNVTGDMDSYGILTKISETSKTTLTPVEGSGESIEEVDYTGTYEVILDGNKTTLTSSIEQSSLTKGAVLIRKNSDGSVKTIRNMKSYAINSVSGGKATASSGSYEIAENAACYIKLDTDTYVLADVYSISDTSAYRLTGYYENGRIRLIVAEPR